MIPKVNATVQDVKATEEFKQYQLLKDKYSAIDKAESLRLEKVVKLLKANKSRLTRATKSLAVAAQESPELLKELTAGLIWKVSGKISLEEVDYTLEKEYVFEIKLR